MSGAMSLFAEMGAEWMSMGAPKPSIRTEEDLSAYMDELQYQADVGRLMGATAAFAFGQDVGIAAITGGTAVEFNHKDSHAAEARAELAAHQSQQQSAQHGGGADDAEAVDEEIARITGLDDTLSMLSGLREGLVRPSSPPFEDIPLSAKWRRFKAEHEAVAWMVGKTRAGIERVLEPIPAISHVKQQTHARFQSWADASGEAFAYHHELTRDPWIMNVFAGQQIDLVHPVDFGHQSIDMLPESLLEVGLAIGGFVLPVAGPVARESTRLVRIAKEQVRAVMREGAYLLGTAEQVGRRVLGTARNAAHKAKESAYIYFEHRLPNTLEHLFSPGGYTKAERELLQYDSMFAKEHYTLDLFRDLPPPSVASPQQMLLWDARGSVASRVAAFEQMRGKKAVQNMMDRKFVQSIANRADRILEGRGPIVGQIKHDYAKRLAERYQRMTGDKLELSFEQRFIRGKEWRKGDGLKGSTRVDVYNTETMQVFDYKFGNAHLSSRQLRRIQETMPLTRTGEVVNVAQIKPSL